MANIIRRDPMRTGGRTLTALQRNMDQLFDDLFQWSESVWLLIEVNKEVLVLM